MRLLDILGLDKNETNSSEPEENNEVVHDWELITQTYAPPVRINPEIQLTPDVIEKAMFGFTTFLWQCNNTRDIRTQVLVGKIVSDDDDNSTIFEQAIAHGPQSYKYKGRTIIVGVAPDDERVSVK